MYFYSLRLFAPESDCFVLANHHQTAPIHFHDGSYSCHPGLPPGRCNRNPPRLPFLAPPCPTSMSASVKKTLPPYDGSVYFPEAVDFHLKHNPDFAAYAFCRDDIPESYTEITFLEFGRAAHRAAHHLRAPGTGSDGEVVAVLANADALLYQTVVMGIMRAGLTV